MQYFQFPGSTCTCLVREYDFGSGQGIFTRVVDTLSEDF